VQLVEFPSVKLPASHSLQPRLLLYLPEFDIIEDRQY
jgi:hypothetical protein